MLQMSSLMAGGGSPADRFPGMAAGLGGFGGAPNPTATPNLATDANNTQTTADTTNAQNTTPPPNPFSDPAMMQQLMSAFGGQGGAGLGGGLFSTPPAPPPTDARPPEERFQGQLQVSIPRKLTHDSVDDVPHHS